MLATASIRHVRSLDLRRDLRRLLISAECSSNITADSDYCPLDYCPSRRNIARLTVSDRRPRRIVDPSSRGLDRSGRLVMRSARFEKSVASRRNNLLSNSGVDRTYVNLVRLWFAKRIAAPQPTSRLVRMRALTLAPQGRGPASTHQNGR